MQRLYFHGNNEHVYIADSYIYTNNNKIERIVAFPCQQCLLDRAMM